MMLRRLADPANAITTAGLCLSVIAISLAIAGLSGLAVAIALWALLADHLDGAVAKRTRNRAAETGEIGKNLDSFADLISAAVFPGVLLITVAAGAWWAIATSVALITASALRLSYFNVFGLDGDKFIGVPTTYVLPVVAACFVADSVFPFRQFAPCLAVVLLTLAVLQITRLRVPKTKGLGYLAITLYCAGASLALVAKPFA